MASYFLPSYVRVDLPWVALRHWSHGYPITWQAQPYGESCANFILCPLGFLLPTDDARGEPYQLSSAPSPGLGSNQGI